MTEAPQREIDGTIFLGQTFDSVSEFLYACDPERGNMPLKMRSSHKDESKRGDAWKGWYGTSSYQEAVDLAKNGWPEGLKEITIVTEELERKINAYMPERRTEYAYQGNVFDIGEFVRGNLECAIDWEIIDSPRPGVNVTIDICASAGISTKVMLARGSVVAGLVYALDRRDVPTTVSVLATNSGDRPEMCDEVIIKHEGQPLDLERLAFCAAHPSMFRRLWFSLWENYPRDVRDRFNIAPGRGYGMVGNVPNKLRGEVHIDGAVYGDNRWADPEKATGWIIDRLVKLGVTIE